MSCGDSLRVANRDYWLNPSRSGATVTYRLRLPAWLGAGIALFTLGMHVRLIHVSALVPPHLDASLAAGLMVGPLAACSSGRDRCGVIFAVPECRRSKPGIRLKSIIYASA